MNISPKSISSQVADLTAAKAGYWSASRLKMLRQCPRQFRFHYVDGLPSPTTPALLFGSVMHQVLREAGEEQMRSGEMPTPPELILNFARSWKGALEEQDLELRPHDPEAKDWLLKGAAMLERFSLQHRFRPRPIAVELGFEVTLGDHRLIGFIDRIDEAEAHGAEDEPKAVVVDYKSGQRKPSPRELASDCQLLIYAYATQQTLGVGVERVEFLFLKDGSRVWPDEERVFATSLLRESLDWAQGCVDEGEFPPTPGYWCRWCPFQTQCMQEGGLPEGRVFNGGGSYGVSR